MDQLSEELRERILAAVEEWAARRYAARLKDVPAEQIVITRASRDSAYDYLVSLNSLTGPAPLRVKITVGQDGHFEISD